MTKRSVKKLTVPKKVVSKLAVKVSATKAPVGIGSKVVRAFNFIGGELVPPVNGKYLASLNPATEELHIEVPLSGPKDIEHAVKSAKAAFPQWSQLKVEERAQFLDRIADGIDQRREELAIAESHDQGKPVALARTMDIPRASYNFRFFAGIIRHELSVAAPLDNHGFSYVRREPIGVAGLISPWNLPLYLLTWKIAPAIAYGNTCVAKPSEMTSHTASILADIIRDAGVPKGVVNLVFGLGSDAGQALVEHKDVKVISFTGGTVTGRKIAQSAAPMLKKVSLELGGKNPTIIFKDADLKNRMAMIVRSSFLNQGEICLCGSRIYVERPLYETFVSEFVRETEKLIVGPPGNAATFMGPLVSGDHRDKVQAFVDEAKKLGMVIHCGGAAPKDLKRGFYFAPTVITPAGKGVTEKSKNLNKFQSSRIQNEEVFGPVVTIAPFDTAEQVIDLANSTRYGLSATVWTESLSLAHGVSNRLDAGTIWVNGWMARDLRMPFGGFKESGMGREGQLDSVHVFTEAKTICIANLQRI
jgi:aminomuconate-semialdehyde/2-hydroxymuconate-6-semialdehyde dehydrogenase